MEQQLEEGIIEVVPEIPTGEAIHYIPHQPVIRDQAESTKMRIVYDYSAKAKSQVPSLNDCLKLDPLCSLWSLTFSYEIGWSCCGLPGDIQKAFLQIKEDPKDRDALRLLWNENLDTRTVTEYRYTRESFGSGTSPYILGATLQKQVTQYAEMFPSTTDELLNNTYMDDFQSDGDHSNQLMKFKEEATKIIQDNGYLKWHYVPTSENPSVQGSRGAEPKKLGRLWCEGPYWLSSPDKWPSQPKCVRLPRQ